MEQIMRHNFLGVEYTIHRDKREHPSRQYEAYRDDIGVTKGWGVKGPDPSAVRAAMENVIKGYLEFDEEDQDAWKKIER